MGQGDEDKDDLIHLDTTTYHCLKVQKLSDTGTYMLSGFLE